jgi:hypothetical protein
MYEGKVSEKLRKLIGQYRERFKDEPKDGFSLFDTDLSHDALVARLERAIAEGKTYNPRAEEWDEETRRRAEAGEIIL